MNQQPLISVIVPIYKIDRYVGLCIESIINQTYKNLEIILVDDGSPDRCPEICDLYAKKDKRIKVIHKENGGLVSARKAGVKIAQGDFIGYVDGDDWIESCFYEKLLKTLNETEAEVAIAGQSRDLFNKSVRIFSNIPEGVYEGKRIEKLYSEMISFGDFYKTGISTYVWNKLFKKDLIKKYQLLVDNNITIGEDAAVVYPLLISCKKICVINDCSYHYRQREDSMLKKSTSFEKEANNLKILYKYLSNALANQKEEYNLQNQIDDFILGMYIMRSGGILKNLKGIYLPYKKEFIGKNIAIYSAGTFGQQLMKRISEYEHCNVVGWFDDDYWEYRRCCLNVDSVETIKKINFDYVLIATINQNLANDIQNRLEKLGVSREKILKFECDYEVRKKILETYLSI